MAIAVPKPDKDGNTNPQIKRNQNEYEISSLRPRKERDKKGNELAKEILKKLKRGGG